jgi:hypothetical protein
MKKYIIKFLFLFLFIILLSSCHGNNNKTVSKITSRAEIKANLSSINSYNGNALIFFTYKNHADPNVYIIQIEEKKSKIFTDKTFDIKRAIRGKCSIFIYVGIFPWRKLDASKVKQKLDFEICNIDLDYNYYVKAWVSYENMVENTRRRETALLTDSCAARNLYYPVGKKNTKNIEFKILN